MEAVHWHNNPGKSKENNELASAIQVADLLTCQLGVTGIENCVPRKNSYQSATGWKILFGERDVVEMESIMRNLENTLERVSRTLHGIL